MEKLGATLKAWRESRQWSQVQLAEKAQVSQQLVTKIEGGHVTESRKLRNLAQAFGVTIEEFLRGPGASVAESSTPPQRVADSISDYKITAYGIQVSYRGFALASEWEKLDDWQKDAYEALIYGKAKQKALERVRKKDADMREERRSAPRPPPHA